MDIDFKWMSQGGILLDGNGDIATTTPNSLEAIRSVAVSRLKANLNGWQLYNIGADLVSFLGNVVDSELELSIRRKISDCLTSNFLPKNSFQIETYVTGTVIRVLVYLEENLLASVEIDRNLPEQVIVK